MAGRRTCSLSTSWRSAVPSSSAAPPTPDARPVPVTVFVPDLEPAVVEGLRKIGIARAVVWMEPCGRDEAEAELDRLAGAVVG